MSGPQILFNYWSCCILLNALHYFQQQNILPSFELKSSSFFFPLQIHGKTELSSVFDAGGSVSVLQLVSFLNILWQFSMSHIFLGILNGGFLEVVSKTSLNNL